MRPLPKLPNGERAYIDPRKLVTYTLNANHPVGGHKARVFMAALQIGPHNADVLSEALRLGAASNEATLERENRFGQHFSLHLLASHRGRVREVRSLWTIRPGEDFPRYVSAFVVG